MPAKRSLTILQHVSVKVRNSPLHLNESICMERFQANTHLRGYWKQSLKCLVATLTHVAITITTNTTNIVVTLRWKSSLTPAISLLPRVLLLFPGLLVLSVLLLSSNNSHLSGSSTSDVCQPPPPSISFHNGIQLWVFKNAFPESMYSKPTAFHLATGYSP